ncbi:MAG: ChbG/HpnK family deacetylase [Deltaproteobacteria bacterium]|nr:ChbG/HpnK family deacetylase [Deltaproteobacteria bacterium]
MIDLYKNIFRLFTPSLNKLLGYSKNDKILLVNIDDVGFHKDETRATFEIFKYGFVKSGSVMVPCPNFDHVVKLYKANQEYGLGIHLTLTCEWGQNYPWSPILPKHAVPTLYNHQGIMWPDVKSLLKNGNRKEIYMEMEAQITTMINAGIDPTHIDHHMDFYYNKYLFSDVMNLSMKYNLPMRVWRSKRFHLPFIKNNLISLRKCGLVFPDTQMGIYNASPDVLGYKSRRQKYINYISELNPGLHNIKLHVALQSPDIKNIMGEHHAKIRNIDYEIWSSKNIVEIAKKNGLKSISYKPLQKLQKTLLRK